MAAMRDPEGVTDLWVGLELVESVQLGGTRIQRCQQVERLILGQEGERPVGRIQSSPEIPTDTEPCPC